MASLIAGERARMYAQAGVLRAGASRANVHSTRVFVAIAGVQYAAARAVDAQKVRNETLVITETEGDTPNTCSFEVTGFQPTDGQEVVITAGSIHNLDRLFAGTILTDAHGYVGTPANGHDVVNVIDDTWQLTRDSITQRWTNTSGTVIARALIADAPRGFTSLLVEAGLPILDEFTVTNQTHAAALTALCDRLGATWKATYHRDVQLGLTANAGQTDPTTVTAASALLTEMTAFRVTRDLSQVITRQPVEGGGVNAFYAAAPGDVVLAVEDVAWYNALGGLVVSGPQRIVYTGLGYGYTPEMSQWHAQAAGLANLAQTWTGAVWVEELRLFVAVSGTPSATGVMTSPDGFVWTARTPATTSAWEAVAWSPTLHLLVAVSLAGLVMTSPDGLTWTLGTAAEDSNWQHVVWAPALSLFVVVATGVATGTHQVMTSPDGLTWTARTAASTNQWFRVAWSPALGLLAAVSQTGTTTAVMTSPDGITWTTRTTTNVLFTIAWSPTLGLFVATGGTVTTTSPDGITWTSHTGALPSANWKALVWSDLGFFVALSDAATSNVAVSTDGLVWTVYTAPVAATGGRWGALAWSPTLARLVAVGFTGTNTGVLITNSALIYRTLTGIPASGGGSIRYAIRQGDPINLRVVVDDLAAQATIAALMLPRVDDGIIEGTVIQDGRISETEARARGTAQLALRSALEVAIDLVGHDCNLHAGRTQAINLPTAPTSTVGSFKLQSVSIGNFQPARWPTRTAHGASRLFTLEMLLRLARGGA